MSLALKTVNVPEHLMEEKDRRSARYSELVERIVNLKPSRRFPHPGIELHRSNWGSRSARQIFMAVYRTCTRRGVKVQLHVDSDKVIVWRADHNGKG